MSFALVRIAVLQRVGGFAGEGRAKQDHSLGSNRRGYQYMKDALKDAKQLKSAYEEVRETTSRAGMGRREFNQIEGDLALDYD